MELKEYYYVTQESINPAIVNGRTSIAYLSCVPLSITYSYGTQPDILLLCSQAVQVVTEMKSAIFDLQKEGASLGLIYNI